MEFITVEQFQKQPKEVQKVFLDWWQPQEFDIYAYKEDLKPRRVTEMDIEDVYNNEVYNVKSGFAIPLFTEGQLREFIEDKTGCKLDATFFLWDGYTVEISKKYEEEGYCISQKAFEHLGEDLLQAYWKVACEIAEQLTIKN